MMSTLSSGLSGQAASAGVLRGGMLPFSPLSIPGLALWLDASRLTLADLDPVTTWPDLSGNGRDASQATAAKKPTFIANGQNGKGVVRFDGVDDWLQALFTLNQPTEIFSVHRYRSARVGDDTAFDGSVALNTMRLFRGDATTYGFAQMYAGAVGPRNDAVTVEQWHLYRCLFNGASSEMSVDSGTAATGDPGAGNGGGVTLGSTAAGAAGFGPVDIAEILLYDSALSTANRQKVEAYLKQRWGIA